METPLVTVIISSYNHAAYIEKSIRSVLEQSYPNIELLVYDDGSTDDSVAIIQKLANQHGFFFQPQANRGLTQTLNAGIEHARGELIAPFGSDDIMLPERFTLQVPWLMAQADIGIAAGNVIKIDEHGVPLPQKRQRHYPQYFIEFENLFGGDAEMPHAPTMLFRKQALQQAGGFNTEIRLEDLYIELKIMSCGWKIGVMTDVLAHYRVHPTNTVKKRRFMHDAVLKTYACFANHPDYQKAVTRWTNSEFLKASNRDKVFARECLQQLPMSAWNLKTLRGLWRLYTANVPTSQT